MTYLWREGILIDVALDRHGRPVHLLWDGRPHPVNQITDRWIIDDRWWDKRTWRDYYKVTTGSGLLLVIFQDVLTRTWYIQRLYD